MNPNNLTNKPPRKTTFNLSYSYTTVFFQRYPRPRKNNYRKFTWAPCCRLLTGAPQWTMLLSPSDRPVDWRWLFADVEEGILQLNAMFDSANTVWITRTRPRWWDVTEFAATTVLPDKFPREFDCSWKTYKMFTKLVKNVESQSFASFTYSP